MSIQGKHYKEYKNDSGCCVVSKSKSLLKTESIIEANIEVHVSCCDDEFDTFCDTENPARALLALFEDGVLMDKDGMVVKIKNFLKETIYADAICLSCHYCYEVTDGMVFDDKSLLKTAEALFDLLLELKDG